jgi:hypothetical protein
VPPAPQTQRRRWVHQVARGIATALLVSLWLGALASVRPVWRAFRGDFRIERPGTALEGTLARRDGSGGIDIDTLTALVLVYHGDCSACRASTDNWVRLASQLKTRYPAVPALIVLSRTTGTEPLPRALGAAFDELQVVRDSVEHALKAPFVPATLVIRRGRLEAIASGSIGPRRRKRLLDLVGVALDDRRQ